MLWKIIEGFPNYRVSDEGIVQHVASIKPLRHQSKRGYATVNLYNNGFMKTCTVHSLVAKAFIPNPNNLPEINHKDENRMNPTVKNLEWCTSSHNKRYSAHNKGTKVFSVDEKGCKVFYVSINEASRQTGVPTSSICRCCQKLAYHKSAKGLIWGYANEMV